MKINVGEYEVHSEGTIVSNPGEIIKFEIGGLIYEFIFTNDEKVSGSRTEYELFDDNKKLTITCINYNSTLGTGNIKPLKIGTLDGKQLYLNYRVYTLTGEPEKGEAGKTVHYTWLTKKKEEEKNG